jgi:hypothetical protein
MIRNTFIMEYIGEVIPQYEFLCRTREYDAEGYKHYYFMTLKNDEVSYFYFIMPFFTQQ